MIKIIAILIVTAVLSFSFSAYADYNVSGAVLNGLLDSNSPGAQTVTGVGTEIIAARIQLRASSGDVAINGIRLATDIAGGLVNFASIKIYNASNNALIGSYPTDKQNPEIIELASPIIIGSDLTKTYIVRAVIASGAAGQVRLGFGGFTYPTLASPVLSGIPVYGNALTLPNATPAPNATSTPTPSLTPSVSASPTPQISVTIIPTDIANALAALKDGDLIRQEHNTAVWVVKRVGDTLYKRWLIAPRVLAAYGHLKDKPVKVVTKETVAAIPSSYLVRRDGDAKVYETWDITEGKTASLRWIPTEQDFLGLGFHFDAVYTINDAEFNFYTIGSRLRVP